MEYILIDPDMLMLQGKEEIINNIDFFRNIIDLNIQNKFHYACMKKYLKI